MHADCQPGNLYAKDEAKNVALIWVDGLVTLSTAFAQLTAASAVMHFLTIEKRSRGGGETERENTFKEGGKKATNIRTKMTTT